MSGNSPNDDNDRRRGQAERRTLVLRGRFMDLATQWMQLRQRFLIAIGIQPPPNGKR